MKLGNQSLLLFAFVFALLTTSCNDENDLSVGDKYTFEFQDGTQGWAGDFADYPVGEEEFYELKFEHANLPEPLDTSKGALMQSGSNRSDDLFMFVKRKIDNLEPNTNYNVSFDLEIASNAPDDWAGIGGAPGEGVELRVGATTIEPQKIDSLNAPGVGYQNYYLMNIDKGNQSQGGKDVEIIGDFSNDTDKEEYALKSMSSGKLPVTTDGEGNLWLMVGTDSAFEGITTIYYNKIEVLVEKQ